MARIHKLILTSNAQNVTPRELKTMTSHDKRNEKKENIRKRVAHEITFQIFKAGTVTIIKNYLMIIILVVSFFTLLFPYQKFISLKSLL